MAFIGIRINHDVGRQLSKLDVPGEKESPSEYHITLLCLEDNIEIHKLAEIMEAAYEVISTFKPFSLKTNKVISFPKYEDNPIPIVAVVESENIHKLQSKLKKAFDKAGIEYSKRFKDYKPHITLSYDDENDKMDSFKFDKIEFVAHEIVLYGGDHGDENIFVNFQLQCPKRHDLLKNKAYLFEKAAQLT